jgi:nucleotide-binding universal stress UspA family protein
MYRKILVGSTDTEQGHDALALGTRLAQACAAELVLATAPAEEGETVAELARAHAADLVVLGSTHRGPVGRIVPGATVERLLGDPPCAVAVAPPGFGRDAERGSQWRPLSGDAIDPGMRVIGVGYDGSRAANEALKIAVDLALANGAALRVYTVASKLPRLPGADGDDRGPSQPTVAEEMRADLHQAVGALPSEVRALPVFIRGFAADELVGAVQTGVDLLILGSRAGGPVRRVFHHSVSSAVMQRAICPVLISPLGINAPEPSLI